MEKLLNKIPVDKMTAMGLSKSNDNSGKLNTGNAYHSHIRPKTQQFTGYHSNHKRNLTGQQLGSLTVEGILYGQPKYTSGSAGGARWVVRCRCGMYEIKKYKTLIKGNRQCCTSCHRQDQIKSAHEKYISCEHKNTRVWNGYKYCNDCQVKMYPEQKTVIIHDF